MMHIPSHQAYEQPRSVQRVPRGFNHMFRWGWVLLPWLGLTSPGGATPIPPLTLDALRSPSTLSTPATEAQSSSLCPVAALNRLTRHTVAPGDSLDSIAQQYNLIPATLIGLNPSLRDGQVVPGMELVIPPYNGLRVTVPQGTTWQALAERYQARADVLFEVNGCEPAPPQVAFIPGVNWSPTPAPPTRSPILTTYPLPQPGTILAAYGWQVNPQTGSVVFNPGVNLAAPLGTSVLAVGAGTVAFSGEQGSYGNLVVINHAEGLQTRYARLDTLSVQVGQSVQAGEAIGTVGTLTPDMPAYLHFEVRTNSDLGWVAQNPSLFIPNTGVGR